MMRRWLSSAVIVLCAWTSVRSASAGVDPAGRGAPSPTSAPTIQHAPSIDIKDATYGALRTTDVCEALEAVKHECQGKIRCSIQVTDQVCLPQRPPSVLIPTLSIRYHCFQDDKDRVASAEKPFRLEISCSVIPR